MKIIKNEDPIITEAVRANDGYCPCATEKTSDTKCMCKDFRDKIKSGYIGECHCGLYKTEPYIVYICGDSRYGDDFLYWNTIYSTRGYLVLLPSNLNKWWTPSDNDVIAFDTVHHQKLYAAEEIFVIDKYGKVSEDLARDIERMKRLGKVIKYASDMRGLT